MNVASTGIPTLYTYEQAKVWHDKVVPFRSGRSKGRRPLGTNRRYDYCQIELIPETNAVIASLYNSDVVTWFPNGEVHISLCGYDTCGTRQFVATVTPFQVQHIRGYTYLGTPHDGKWYVFDGIKNTMILVDGVVTNPVQQISYKINRKAMKEVQERYSAFREYVKSMGQILTGITEADLETARLPREERTGKLVPYIQRVVLPTASNAYYHGFTKPITTIVDFFRRTEKAQAEDNLEEFRNLFMHLGVSALSYSSYLKGYVSNSSHKNADVTIGKQMLEFFDEMLKYYYKQEVFFSIEVPIGEKSTNLNAKYFN